MRENHTGEEYTRSILQGEKTFKEPRNPERTRENREAMIAGLKRKLDEIKSNAEIAKILEEAAEKLREDAEKIAE